MEIWRTHQKLKSDFTWVLIGNTVFFACQWGIVLALAKLGTAEQVGEYALGMAVAAPIVMFANLQLRSLIASDVRDQFKFSDYLGFRTASLVLALVAIAGVTAAMAPGWRRGGIILLVGVVQISDYVSDFYYAWMQKYERMDRLAISLLVKGPVSLGALIVAMYWTHSVLWAVTGLLAGRLVIFLVWDSRLGLAGIKIPKGGSPNWPVMPALLRTALPLGIISMLASLNANIPRYFLESSTGAVGLGIFSAIASLLSAGNLVVSALGQAIFLPVAKACAEADRPGFRSSVLLACASGGALGLCGVLIAVFFGREILTILFRPEYAEHPDVFVVLMIAGMITFIGSSAGWVMTAARSLKEQIPLLVVTGLAAAAVSYVLIPRIGLMGAAYAMVAASLVQAAGACWILIGIDRNLRVAEPAIEAISEEARSRA
jgi:O-antigen/teichoic acid export membrane protein